MLLAGLATNFCVAYSAEDAAKEGFEAIIVEDACGAINLDGSLTAAWERMQAVGVHHQLRSGIALTHGKPLDMPRAQPPPRQVPASVRTHLLSGARRWQWSWRPPRLRARSASDLFPWRLADTLQVDFDGQSGYGEVRQSVFVKIAVGSIFMRRKRLFSTLIVYIDHLGTSQVAYCLTTRQHKPGERVAIEFSRSYPQITHDKLFCRGLLGRSVGVLFPLLVVFAPGTITAGAGNVIACWCTAC